MGSTTARGAFPYPDPNDPTNPPGDLAALANRLAAVGALDSQGTLAARPAAAAAGRGHYYWATEGRLFRSDGTDWFEFPLDDPVLEAAINAHLSDTGDAHGTAGILDGAITTPKLADTSVSFAKLVAAVREAMFEIGDVKWKASDNSPGPSWFVADGRELDRAAYAAAFALWGTRFGPGNGTTTFNIPNLIDSVAYGAANNAGVAQRAAGLSHDHARTGAVGNGNATHTHGVTVDQNAFNTGGHTTDHTHGFGSGVRTFGGTNHDHGYFANQTGGSWQTTGGHNQDHTHDLSGITTGGASSGHAHSATHAHTASSNQQLATHAHPDTIAISANTASNVTKLVPFIKVA